MQEAQSEPERSPWHWSPPRRGRRSCRTWRSRPARRARWRGRRRSGAARRPGSSGWRSPCRRAPRGRRTTRAAARGGGGRRRRPAAETGAPRPSRIADSPGPWDLSPPFLCSAPLLCLAAVVVVVWSVLAPALLASPRSRLACWVGSASAPLSPTTPHDVTTPPHRQARCFVFFFRFHPAALPSWVSCATRLMSRLMGKEDGKASIFLV